MTPNLETRDRFEIKRSYSTLGRWMLTDKQTGKVTYHCRRAEAIVRRARLAEAPTTTDILQRIMELQATGEARALTESEKADLYRLETEWSNRWCLDFPTRVRGGA